MTTESNVVDATNDDAVDAANEEKKIVVDATKNEQEVETGQSLAEQLRALKEVNTELIRTRDAAKQKIRETEKNVADLKEKLVSKIVTDSLKAELAKAGALSVDTALKLVDKSKIQISDEFELDTKSLESIVEELRKSDSILFKPITDGKEEKSLKAPSLGRPAESDNIADSFSVLMKAAKTQAQVDELLMRFGKK